MDEPVHSRLRLSKVIDFYYIETLLALTDTNKSIHHPRMQEKLVSDLRNTLSELSESLSRVLVDYLTIACMEESEHSYSTAQYSYSNSMESAEHTRESILRACRDLFYMEGWSSSYGGDAWGHIAEYALEYYTIPSLPAWLDHIFDVEHNGGELFDKENAAKRAGLYVDFDGKSKLCRFLTYKFECENILAESNEWSYFLSPITVNLIQRYSNIFDVNYDEYIFINSGRRSHQYFHVNDTIQWGDNLFVGLIEETNRNVCTSCGASIPDDECYTCEHCGYPVCSDCSNYTDSCGVLCNDCMPGMYTCILCDSDTYNNSEVCDSCEEIYSKCDECEEYSVKVNEDNLCEECAEKAELDAKLTCKICEHKSSVSVPVYECGFCLDCIKDASLFIETGKPTTGITAWFTKDHFSAHPDYANVKKYDHEYNSKAKESRLELLGLLRDNGNDYLSLMVIEVWYNDTVYWQYQLVYDTPYCTVKWGDKPTQPVYKTLFEGVDNG